MDWPELVAILLSGLGGVVLGAVITTHQHSSDEARANQAAARVVYFELAENTGYLDTAINNAVTMPVRTATWASHRDRLANLLSPGDFAIVATAFMKLAATADAWDIRGPATPQGPNSIAATRDVLARVEQAAGVLYPHAWPMVADRAALDAELQEHVAAEVPASPAADPSASRSAAVKPE